MKTLHFPVVAFMITVSVADSHASVEHEPHHGLRRRAAPMLCI